MQREIVSRVAVTVAYVGNRTVRLQSASRNNDPPPGPGDIQSRRPYPQWGPDTFAQWGGKADYHGLQNQIEIRDWNGLTMMGSYVFSKCMDSGTDESGPYTSPRAARKITLSRRPKTTSSPMIGPSPPARCHRGAG